MNTQNRHLSTARLFTGGALIAAGAMLGLQAVGILHFLDLGRSWPLFVIVLAFVKIGATLRNRHVQGWGLLLAGDWLLANSMTDWAYVQLSAPMLLAGFGLATIIRGLRDYSGNSDENRYAIQ
jgi:hypothetical protein